MDYDAYEREMVAAGWSLDDIEAMWQAWELDAPVEGRNPDSSDLEDALLMNLPHDA